MTLVARSVFVRWTTGAATDAVDVLITLGGVFSKVNTSSKHSTNVSMTLVEALLDDGVDEWGSMEEHPFVALVVIFLSHFASPMRISLPEFHVTDLLDLGHAVLVKDATSMALITVFSYGRLHLLLHRLPVASGRSGQLKIVAAGPFADAAALSRAMQAIRGLGFTDAYTRN